MTGSMDFYGMGWEVQHFQDVEVIRHNGEVPGYTADMFLVPEKNIAVAMVMNTYSPMLGIRASRLPSSVLRILLGQEIIPGNEFLYMRIIYGLVMLIPVLQIIAVLTTLRRFLSLQKSAQSSMPLQIALPLIWDAVIAYVLLVTLPGNFGADIPTMILFQPDVGWTAVLSGVFAIVWGFLRTSLFLRSQRDAML
ncbi:MAG TPA: serine hydrolase, partial [Anaerolineales bacterium]|nr:serine hydrolase [Anaerolineales bacterium]